ncbi:MAG: glutathione peroxidase [Bacteroidota bacterium]
MDQTVHQFTMKSLAGEDIALENYAGKALLIVNTASECGLTPQYADLQDLHEMYADKDFAILGFPANNFGAQEPGTDPQIANFCKVNYGVTFQMFSKISVKGDDQHPLYQFLTSKDKNGVADSEVQWNFQKYLVGKDGKLIRTFAPTSNVGEDEIQSAIQAAIN